MKGKVGLHGVKGSGHPSQAVSSLWKRSMCTQGTSLRVQRSRSEGQSRPRIKRQMATGSRPPAKNKQDRAAIISFQSQHKGLPGPTSITQASPHDTCACTHMCVGTQPSATTAVGWFLVCIPTPIHPQPPHYRHTHAHSHRTSPTQSLCLSDLWNNW